MTRKYWAGCVGLQARRPGPARCIAAGLSASVGPPPRAGAAKLVLPSTPGQAPGLGADKAPVQRPGLQPATAAGRQVQARAGRWLECGKSSCAIAWRTLMVSGLLSYDQDPYVIAAGDSCGITDPRRTLMVSRGGGLSWTLLVLPVPFGITAEGSSGITDPRRTLMRPQAVAVRAYTRAAKSGGAGSLTEKRGSCLSCR